MSRNRGALCGVNRRGPFPRLRRNIDHDLGRFQCRAELSRVQEWLDCHVTLAMIIKLQIISAGMNRCRQPDAIQSEPVIGLHIALHGHRGDLSYQSPKEI